MMKIKYINLFKHIFYYIFIFIYIHHDYYIF